MSSFHEHTLGKTSRSACWRPLPGTFRDPAGDRPSAGRLPSHEEEVKVEFLDYIYTRFDLAIGSAGLDRVELRDFLPETGCPLAIFAVGACLEPAGRDTVVRF